MTASEFKYEFLVEYDRVANLSSPGYEDDEISLFLTKGQERLVKRHYNPKSNRLGEGVDSTEKRKKNLAELVTDSVNYLTGTSKISVSANQKGILPNGVFYDLPGDLMFVLSETATVDVKDVNDNDSVIEVKPVTYDEYSVNIKNPFKKPCKEEIWRLEFSSALNIVNSSTTLFGITIPTISTSQGAKRHELITDGTYNILDYKMRYVRKPNPIIVSNLGNLSNPKTIEGFSGPLECELDSSYHREIISEAVAIALETAQEKRYTTHRQETQLTE